jgi:hypothetical protein
MKRQVLPSFKKEEVAEVVFPILQKQHNLRDTGVSLPNSSHSQTHQTPKYLKLWYLVLLKYFKKYYGTKHSLNH